MRLLKTPRDGCASGDTFRFAALLLLLLLLLLRLGRRRLLLNFPFATHDLQFPLYIIIAELQALRNYSECYCYFD